MGVNDVISGPVHTVFTVTVTSTDGLNSTMQVRVMDAPAYTVPTGGLTVTAVGGGTEGVCAENRMMDLVHKINITQHTYVLSPLS